MTTHLAEHFQKKRNDMKLSLAHVARMIGYRNIAKGVRRIETFEKTGNITSGLLVKLTTALEIDQATARRLAYEDYKEWFAGRNQPVAPYMVRRILFGGGLRRVPRRLKSVPAMEEYAADFARKCGMDVCLILSRRIRVRFSEQGTIREVVEETPRGE